MYVNHTSFLNHLRETLIKDIIRIVSLAPGKKVEFRRNVATDGDDECEEILYDLNVGERDQDGCYPTVVHVRIDLGNTVEVCTESSCNDTDIHLTDLSVDDLAGIYDGLCAIRRIRPVNVTEIQQKLGGILHAYQETPGGQIDLRRSIGSLVAFLPDGRIARYLENWLTSAKDEDALYAQLSAFWAGLWSAQEI